MTCKQISLCQIAGKLYLPPSLFKVGLWALMHMASLTPPVNQFRSRSNICVSSSLISIQYLRIFKLDVCAILDTLTVKQQDGNVKVKVYRKPPHTDQYLDFESNQPLDHKLSVVRTLHHRADNVLSDPEDVRQEKKNINKALHACGYSTWAIHRALQTPKREL